ncbi:MAG: hypothetical protein WBY84_24285, partial [Pseudolabrys sp.]
MRDMTCGELLGLRACLLAVVLMQQPLRRLADQLRFWPAENRCPGRVYIEKLAIRIRDCQQVLRDIPDLKALVRLGPHALLKRFV